MPNINEDDYKAMLISDWKYAPKDKDLYLEYSFENDTLCVRGVQDSKSHFSIPYAECLITGKQIVFMLKQSESFMPIKKEFSVKIPGFQPGTYQVGMPGSEYVTLECKGGTTGIGEVKSEGVNAEGVASKKRERSGKSEKYDDAVYDLSGRRVNFQLSPVNSQLKKGIYIQNGKKVAIK